MYHGPPMDAFIPSHKQNFYLHHIIALIIIVAKMADLLATDQSLALTHGLIVT